MNSTGSSASSTNSSSSRRAFIALRPPKPHGERGLRPQPLQLCQPAVEGREPTGCLFDQFVCRLDWHWASAVSEAIGLVKTMRHANVHNGDFRKKRWLCVLSRSSRDARPQPELKWSQALLVRQAQLPATREACSLEIFMAGVGLTVLVLRPSSRRS
jgi:hypothetical protein